MAKKNLVNEVAAAVGTAAGAAAARVEVLKPKRSTSAKHSKAKVAAAAPVAEVETPARVAVDCAEVARLAYLNWESRGGQDGSPEQDWLLAEQELIARANG